MEIFIFSLYHRKISYSIHNLNWRSIKLSSVENIYIYIYNNKTKWQIIIKKLYKQVVKTLWKYYWLCLLTEKVISYYDLRKPLLLFLFFSLHFLSKGKISLVLFSLLNRKRLIPLESNSLFEERNTFYFRLLVSILRQDVSINLFKIIFIL